MSTKGIGYVTVRKGLEILGNNGYIYDTTEKHGRFVKYKDLFSKYGDAKYDAIAIKKNVTKLIQFKTGQMPTLGPYKEFSEKYPQLDIEIWCRIKGKGFRIIQYISGVKKTWRCNFAGIDVDNKFRSSVKMRRKKNGRKKTKRMEK